MNEANRTLTLLSDKSSDFPDLSLALQEPNGLLAVGGDLSPSRLISAYSSGIFPWYSDGEPIMWWSPDPRAIIPLAQIKINRTLRKFINRCNYTVTVNHAFEEVIELCADAPFRKEDTWIVDDMLDAYKALHIEGKAHSIDVWHEGQLVGGLYGIAINGFFSGESMFYAMPNASKIALIGLGHLLASEGITFIDCQLANPFLEDMGCIEVARDEFIIHKQNAINIELPTDFWQPREISIT